jgi:DNA primase
MINPELIKQAEAVAIVDYLAAKGIEPVHAVAKELVYFSPLRDEKNASFYVNPTKNKFHDFTNEDHKGNIIRLVQLLEVINFPQAIDRLINFTGQPFDKRPSPFLSATQREPVKQSSNTIGPLQNPVLINYVKERGIPYSIGKMYLQEVMTTSKERNYFTVGFRNDSNGFALRNKYFKGCEGVQDITTFDLESRTTVAVFEGFFDFLSALVWFGLEAPRIPTVILNSTNNRKKAIDYLRQFKQVNCFFDRDKAGSECLRLFKERDELNVKDYSTIYEGFNDFNEMLMKKR